MAKIVILGAGVMGSAFSIPCIENNHEIIIAGTHLDNNFIDHINQSNNFHPVLKINQAAVQHLQELRHVVSDDLIILTRGDVEAVPGVSNTMKIIRVE